ncbi:tellurite resistance TerB family protein [Ancylobacter moscoviensis]|nr:tellurite resistance TerB family protein [Ancylobacter moscoviensis]
MSNGRNFDAGQLVDQLLGMRSGGGGAGNNPLGDLLGGILGGGARQGGAPAGGAPAGGQPGGISLQDLLGGILGGGAGGRVAQPSDASLPSGGAPSGGQPGGISLEDLLGGILGGGAAGGRVSQPGNTAPPTGGAPSGGGGGLPGGISLEDLLGGLLGGGAGRAPQPGGGSASGGAPSGGGGGLPGGISLEDLLGGILGGGGAAGGGRAPRGSGDDSLGDFAADALAGRRGQTPAQLGDFGGGAPTGLTSEIAGNPDVVNAIKDYLSRNGGVLAGGAAAGSLATLVLGSKGGRKLATNAVALGGIALVGTLAYKAYQNYQRGQAPQDVATPPEPAQLPPPQSPFHPAQASQTELPVVILRTMIAAALADGHVDDVERAAIGAKLSEDGAQLDAAERFLSEELANPATVEEIASEVTAPEAAAEVYIAALLAIDADNTAERAFLARLATALKLDPALLPHLEAAAHAARQV